MIEVMGCEPGRVLRAGMPDGPLGSAEVLSVSADAVEFRLRLDRPAPPPPAADLLLAMPRPKVLARILQHAAAIGVGRIVLVRTWRVEKSYFQTDLLEPPAIRENLLLGLEQGGVDSRIPEVLIEPLFKPFLEDRLSETFSVSRRVLLDPGADTSLVDEEPKTGERTVYAVGPERGFTDYERQRLTEAGFLSRGLGSPVLRVEAACILALGFHRLKKERNSPT